jgi:Flp pilus assembly pilin Flp
MSTVNIVHQRNVPARLSATVRRFASDCSGAVALEYAIAAAILGIAVALAVSELSGAVSELYQHVIDAFG